MNDTLRTEAQIAKWAMDRGFTEARTAMLYDQFALEIARFERGTDKAKLDAGIALAGMPWLGDEERAYWQQKVEGLMKPHAKVGAPPSAKPQSGPSPATGSASPSLADRARAFSGQVGAFLFGGARESATQMMAPPSPGVSAGEPAWVAPERKLPDGRRVRKAADGWRVWDGRSWQKAQN